MVTLFLVSTTDPYTAALSATSTPATALECAHTKNRSANPLESALAKSLDLNFPEINTYRKWGGDPPAFYPLLFTFCLLPRFLASARASGRQTGKNACPTLLYSRG